MKSYHFIVNSIPRALFSLYTTAILYSIGRWKSDLVGVQSSFFFGKRHHFFTIWDRQLCLLVENRSRGWNKRVRLRQKWSVGAKLAFACMALEVFTESSLGTEASIAIWFRTQMRLMCLLMNLPVLCSLDSQVARVSLCAVAVVKLMLCLLVTETAVVLAEIDFATSRAAGESCYSVFR